MRLEQSQDFRTDSRLRPKERLTFVDHHSRSWFEREQPGQDLGRLGPDRDLFGDFDFIHPLERRQAVQINPVDVDVEPPSVP